MSRPEYTEAEAASPYSKLVHCAACGRLFKPFSYLPFCSVACQFCPPDCETHKAPKP